MQHDRFTYRGRDKKTREWIHGSLLRTDIEPLDYLICYAGRDIGAGTIACDPETVGQCTGRPDMNDTAIFEDDVLLQLDENGEPDEKSAAIVTWFSGSLIWGVAYLNDPTYDEPLYDYMLDETVVVAGNRFDDLEEVTPNG